MLEEKISNAIFIIREALDTAARPAVAFGGGKDSMVLLHLVRKATGDPLPFPVLTLDTAADNSRLYYFVEKMRKLWRLDLLRQKAHLPDTVDAALNPCAKTYPGVQDLVKVASTKYGFTHLFMGFRTDEEGVSGEIAPALNCGPVNLINPLLNFTESDIRDYIEAYRLPSCSLYGKDIKKLRCLPGEAALMAAGRTEENEASDDEQQIKTRLKALGYL